MTPDAFRDQWNQDEDHRDEGDDRWHLLETIDTPQGTKARLVRDDGRYRWRHDAFRGF
jgi:hypothetical protein